MRQEQPQGLTSLNISLPHSMKSFIEEQLAIDGFSTPSEYVRASSVMPRLAPQRSASKSFCCRASTATNPLKRNQEASERFFAALQTAAVRLAEFPCLGSPRYIDHPRFSGLRFWTIPGFERYLIFYRVTDDALEVIRVLHSARDIEAVLDDEVLTTP